MPRLTTEQITEFLTEPGHLTRIATVDADGAPSVAPIWFLYDDGRIWFTPREKSSWWHHIQREPRVAQGGLDGEHEDHVRPARRSYTGVYHVEQKRARAAWTSRRIRWFRPMRCFYPGPTGA